MPFVVAFFYNELLQMKEACYATCSRTWWLYIHDCHQAFTAMENGIDILFSPLTSLISIPLSMLVTFSSSHPCQFSTL
jgi:hypothetical protein